jgi:hypothetical protein
MTEQTESTPTDAANTSPPMPSIWLRSVALAAFFTLVGPAIGSAGLLLFLSFFKVFLSHPEAFFTIGQVVGTPFAGLCGLFLGIRAAFSGRVNVLEVIGAALAATLIVMNIGLLPSFVSHSILSAPSFSSFIKDFVLFAAPSLLAAIVCRWLFYLLFWPRKADDALN